LLDGVDESYINLASTDFAALGDLASTFLEKKHPKILVVFTDGGDTTALKGFKQSLKDANITLYTVLVGTQKGAPVLDANNRPIHTKQGTIAISQRNDALLKIAQSTGGKGIVATNGKGDMHTLAATIHRTFKSQQQGKVTIKERTEFFIYLLAAATVLLLLGLMSLPRKNTHRFGSQS